MSVREDFLKLIRADEYNAESEKERQLNEAAAANSDMLALDIAARLYPSEKMKFQTNVTKAVMAECVARLYMNSLLIENADQYKDSLMPIARAQVMESLKDYGSVKELTEAMSNASPYVKEMFALAEAINENHDDIIDEKDNLILSKLDCYRVMNKDTNTVIGYVEADNPEEAKKKFRDGKYENMDDYVKKSDSEDDEKEKKPKEDDDEDDKEKGKEEGEEEKDNDDEKDEEEDHDDEEEKKKDDHDLNEAANDSSCGVFDKVDPEKRKEIKAKAKNPHPFPNKLILDKDDLRLIHEWEKIQGSNDFADELQTRVAKVYAEEEEAAKAQKEKIQSIVNALSNIPGETVQEAVSGSFNTISNEPKSIFNAIFINKSKQALNESGEGSNVSSNSEDIMCETICTYTLLETIHSLGIHTYTPEEKRRLMYQFVTA